MKVDFIKTFFLKMCYSIQSGLLVLIRCPVVEVESCHP